MVPSVTEEGTMGNAEVRGLEGVPVAGAAWASTPGLYTVEVAAVLLDTTPAALRARCRRNARREGREVVARLGAGVVGFKFGVNWRVRFLQA
jgi:hypothetical protein